jgi:curved DNA-binding protein
LAGCDRLARPQDYFVWNNVKFKDYYQTMGIARTASAGEIKQAYRKLAHQFHPDVSSDALAKEKFQDIGEAYAVLKDPEKRLAYDQLGKAPVGADFSPPPGWQHNVDPNGAAFDDVDLGDLFAAFGRSRGGAARQPSPVRGQDFEISAAVSLEQIHSAGEIEVRASLPETDPQGVPHRVSRTFRITVPVGAADGQRLRLAGKGGPGLHGGRAGDLYVALALTPHPVFRVSGRDLYMDLALAPWEAVLGAVIRVPTLDGPVELNVKAGSTGGQQLRLAKRGLRAADGSIGALHAVIVIKVPAAVSDAERALYQQLAAASDFQARPSFA